MNLGLDDEAQLPPATYGMLVVGVPGSGKTTLCAGYSGFLNAIGRDTVVNLDPASHTEASRYASVVIPHSARRGSRNS